MPNNSSEGKNAMNYEDLESEFLQYASIVKLTEGQEMTIIEVAAAVNSIKSGLDIFKNFADTKDNAKHSDLIRIISTMNRELAKLENELATNQRELTAKDKEITQLKEKLAKPKEKLDPKKINNYWYLEADIENPVCKACFDSKAQTITLSKTERITQRVTGHKYICPICKTSI
jgi:predicted RNase H-like nuclease (RuvC/YqgF family)